MSFYSDSGFFRQNKEDLSKNSVNLVFKNLIIKNLNIKEINENQWESMRVNENQESNICLM